MSFSIRKFRKPDIGGMLQCWENASRIAHAFLPENFIEQERENIPTVYLPVADTWVAEFESRVVGFISLLGNEVGAIFVEPLFQGRGIGLSLMNKARDMHGNLEVEVFKENVVARRFYSVFGFEFQYEKIHHETGQKLFHLKYINPEK